MPGEEQSKAIQFQLLQRQLEALQEERKQIVDKQAELRQTKETLDQIKKSGKEEILSPLGAGSFVFAKLTDSEHVLTALGAGVACKKTMPEAQRILDGRIKETDKVKKGLDDEIGSVVENMEKLAPHLQQ